MTFSTLTILVIAESLVILLFVLAYFIRKNIKLKKTIDDLLRKLSESIFTKLLKTEIEKTIEHIKNIGHSNEDELELAADDDRAPTHEEEKVSEVKKMLTFRSAYLHAEINANESSAGNTDLFWSILSDNIASLIQNHDKDSGSESAEPNEFIDEIMQELQNKLDKSTESNLSLQALLDSLLANGHLAADQIQIIKNSQADFHDLSQHVSDLDNKIQNSLNIEIVNTKDKNKANTSDNTVIVENASHVVNKEVNKLKDVIYDQGNKINALLKSLKDGIPGIEPDSELHQHLSELERSQKETSMCLEVLEMENKRLMDEISTLHENITPSIDGVDVDEMSSDQLRVKVQELEQTIKEKEKEYQLLHNELNSVEKEFMAVYDKGAEENNKQS